MTRTLIQLVTTTRNRLNETAARQWSDDKLREWVMEGARDIARRCECLLSTTSFAVVAGTGAYTFASVVPGIVRVHRMEYVRAGDTANYMLEYRDRHAMDAAWGTSQAITPGTPRLFTLWGFPPNLTVQLYPVPSEAGTATLFYYALPTDLTTIGTSANNSVVQCPEGWEDVIVDYAEYHALRMDRDERWKDVMQAYEQRLIDLNSTSIRWSDQAGMITGDTGFVPSWLVEGSY